MASIYHKHEFPTYIAPLRGFGPRRPFSGPLGPLREKYQVSAHLGPKGFHMFSNNENRPSSLQDMSVSCESSENLLRNRWKTYLWPKFGHVQGKFGQSKWNHYWIRMLTSSASINCVLREVIKFNSFSRSAEMSSWSTKILTNMTRMRCQRR